MMARVFSGSLKASVCQITFNFGGAREAVRFGHPSGTLRVGAAAEQVNGEWTVKKAVMSRSARVIMEGWVRIPEDTLNN